MCNRFCWVGVFTVLILGVLLVNIQTVGAAQKEEKNEKIKSQEENKEAFNGKTSE